MGRTPDFETFNGKPLMTSLKGDTYRVSFNPSSATLKSGKKVGAYLLWKNNKKIKTKRQLKDIAIEFYTITAESNSMIELPSVIPTKEISTTSISTTPNTGNIPKQIEGGYSTDDGIVEVVSKPKRVTKEQIEWEDTETRQKQAITPEFVVTEFMKLLSKDKHQVAALANTPAFANLEDYMIPHKTVSYTIEQLIQAYREKTPEPTPEALRNAESYFNEFVTICGIHLQKKVKTIDQITGEAVQYYKQQIHKVATNAKYLPNWLTPTQKTKLKQSTTLPRHYWHKHRIQTTKEVLNNAVDVLIHDPNSPALRQFDNLKFWLEKISTLKKVKKVPSIVSVEDFNKLIKASDLKWECMLRLMLNCAFTLIDITNLRKEDINLKKGELIKNREKEVSPLRYAKLHPTTLKVLKQYMKENPNDTEFIFVGEKNQQLKVPTTRVSFNRLKKRAGVAEAVQAKYLRKTAATTATNYAGITEIHIKLLMGQSCNILDHYLNKAMKIVGDACIYVCDQYFK